MYVNFRISDVVLITAAVKALTGLGRSTLKGVIRLKAAQDIVLSYIQVTTTVRIDWGSYLYRNSKSSLVCTNTLPKLISANKCLRENLIDNFIYLSISRKYWLKLGYITLNWLLFPEHGKYWHDCFVFLFFVFNELKKEFRCVCNFYSNKK